MRHVFSKWTAVFPAVIAGTLLFAGLASAHITVKPSASKPKAYETYTLKIPVEKEVPTVKIAIKVPAGVDFKNYQPVPGWKVETVKDDAGRITTVTWAAEGDGGIEPGQFQQFNFVAKNPDKETSIAWDAYQYYKDGTIVEWTGDGGESPHSVTTVSASADASAASDSGHDDHGAAAPDNQSSTAAEAPAAGTETAGSATNTASPATDTAASATDTAVQASSGSSSAQTLSIVLSAAALATSLAALWVSILFVRRIKR
ncbi:YcnI family protein [Paenibacillus sp. YPG26]|uniref:YcnI family copper-binding membrane protein n=1 Tax=Paenibacillus sp. YPG26 TaxID=2878915 RepID=UPI002040F58D|nr:YcnI family protein [Paenibacillus sp. YPG26]USB33692.1 YcnI family protein [Paenibacillus sp. YPG26]